MELKRSAWGVGLDGRRDDRSAERRKEGFFMMTGLLDVEKS